MLLLTVVAANFLTRTLAVGVALFLSFRVLSRWANAVTTVAAGLLLTIACTHLIPEAIHEGVKPAEAGVVLLISFIGFFLLECVLSHWTGHTHGASDQREISEHSGEGDHVCASPVACARTAVPRATALLFGVACHNFVDGILVAAAFMLDATGGWLVAGAILAHEVPQVVGQLVILTQTGMSRHCAAVLTYCAALAAVVGGMAGVLLLTAVEGIVGYAMLVSAASFIYVVLAVLLPEASHGSHEAGYKMPWREIMGVVAGVLLSLVILEPLHEGAHVVFEHDGAAHAQHFQNALGNTQNGAK